MKNLKNIFFDLDHTIWDFEKNSALTFEKLLKKYNVRISLERFLKIYVPLNFEYWKLYREEKITKEFLRYNRLKSAFDKLEYEISDEIINSISDDYIKYLPKNYHLMPMALETLDYLSERYNLFIITNGFKNVQKNKINSSGISKYFKKIYDSETVGVKKPNPYIFEYSLNDSKSKKTDSIMIGDSYEADIKGALDYGLEAIHLIAHGEALHSDCKIIHKLDELMEIL